MPVTVAASLLVLQASAPASLTWIPPVESRSAVVLTLATVSPDELIKKIAGQCSAQLRKVVQLGAGEVLCEDSPDHASLLAYMTESPKPSSGLEAKIRFQITARGQGAQISAVRMSEYTTIAGKKVRLLSEETAPVLALLAGLEAAQGPK